METIERGETRSAAARRVVRRCRSERRRSAATTVDRPTSDLVAAAAHEMRTPLTSIAMTAEMLEEAFDAIDRDEAIEMLQRIQRGAVWLQNLVENLALARAAVNGAVALRKQPVRPIECVEEAVSLVAPILTRKGQSVRVHCARRNAIALVDPVRLRQVVLNLLVNAHKYSIEGDTIDLHVALTRGQVAIAVADHGPGIEPAERERIFRPYERGAAAADAKGLGLGLSIVKAIVEMHGGEIGLESSPGQGATFLITLPMGKNE
jgi:signal transduction histidine kinase